ncbi:MAG: hypothetical protein HYX48_02430 [Chlamydiales bacterium]|nr:hypothetical protein [Chlamydiales bacterium]
MKTRTLQILLLCIPFLLKVQIVEGASEPAAVSQIKSTETSAAVVDADTLRGFSSLTFFLYVPASSSTSSKKMEESAKQLLEKFGRVISKTLSVQSPFSEEDNKNGFLKNPFLTYEIKNIQDLTGKELPILKASLTFEAPATIIKNKEYCHSTLWSRNCYIQQNANTSMEKAVSQTLTILLKDFEKDYAEANKSSPLKPTIYFAE